MICEMGNPQGHGLSVEVLRMDGHRSATDFDAERALKGSHFTIINLFRPSSTNSAQTGTIV